MSHPKRSKLKLRKRLAQPYLDDCKVRIRESREAFTREFIRVVSQAKSVERLHSFNLLNRPASRVEAAKKTISFSYNPTNYKKVKKLDYAQQKHNASLNPIVAGNNLALRVSRNIGNTLQLSKYGFVWTPDIRGTTAYNGVWIVSLSTFDRESLFRDYPKLRGTL